MKIINKLICLIAISLMLSLTLTGCSKEEHDDAEAHAESTDSEEHDGHEEENGDHEEENEHDEERIVKLSNEELIEFGIEVKTAGPGEIKTHLKLSGEIVVQPDHLAHIVPRFPGLVQEVRKHIGDHVRKGEILAIIESNESLAPYEVKSLIAGTVTDKHLSLGEVITDDSHAFIITDLSEVWVNLNVYQKDLPHIKLGQNVVISTGLDSPEATGKISYISPLLDENTRTATARVVLPNPDGLWRPGLFVTGHVETNSTQKDIVVPKTAIETIEDQSVIFVKTPEGFIPETVILGQSNSNSVEVSHGLKQGDKYVSKGGFTLKAELGKGSLDSGHAH